MRLLLSCLTVVLLSSAGLAPAQVPCCATQGGVTTACSADGRVVCGDGTLSTTCSCQAGVSPGLPTLGQLLMPLTTVFGEQPRGSTSAISLLTLTNYGALPVTVTSVTSDAPAEFIIVANTCSVVPAGKGCTVSVAFKPTVFGPRGTLIRVVSTGVGSPQSFAVYGTGTAAVVELVEYFHAAWNHYFITSNADEIKKLDEGTFVGWQRTGHQFKGYATGAAPGAAAMCRFFSIAFDPRSSHFYTPIANECTAVKANNSWSFEGEVFGVALPTTSGACAAGAVPLYRLYNDGQGGAPNHRYTTDLAVRNLMLVFGWVPEGFGATGVIACLPP